MINYILNSELAMKERIISATDLKIDEEELTVEDIDEIIKTTEIEVVEEKNIKTRHTNKYGSVEIRNESDYILTEDILKPDIDFLNKKDIILFSTHTCESYTPSEKYSYEMTGNYRTTDLNYTVSRLGEELKNRLEKNGYNVIHNTTYHDYPTYSGSYNRSLTTIENILKDNKAELIIDLHRDAVGNGSDYGPTVKINDEYAAQLMFVIGTDGGGLEHPNWQQNLKLAIKIQEKANELYPGLFRPIIVRNSRYNQHLAKGACIIEVGATGNTLEQAILSMKYLSNIISETM